MMDERIVVGCMSGTSLDGLDAALVRIRGHGMSIEASLVAHRGMPFDIKLAATLRDLASGQAAPASAFVRAARQLGEMHAKLIRQLCGESLSANENPDLVVAHGQTIWHDGEAGMSWQLMDPWPIVHGLGVRVCHDLRQADLIAGGHGAPITPLADWIMHRAPNHSRLIVNLGGICNVTWLPDAACAGGVDAIRAGDVGPCNLLIDGVVRRLVPEIGYDRDGELSNQGTIDLAGDDRIQPLMKLIEQATRDRRTLGREQFDDKWLDGWVAPTADGGTAYDQVAMAVAAAAWVVVNGVNEYQADEVILCGGGARNPTLIEAIRSRIGGSCTIRMGDELGVPCEAREAMAMAVLGALAADGVPITLPQVTGGGTGPAAGSWAGPLSGECDSNNPNDHPEN